MILLIVIDREENNIKNCLKIGKKLIGIILPCVAGRFLTVEGVSIS